MIESYFLVRMCFDLVMILREGNYKFVIRKLDDYTSLIIRESVSSLDMILVKDIYF